MSGRGRGRSFNSSRGRGRTGRGGRSNFGGSSYKSQERKSVNDYVYSIGTTKQASDFVVVTKFLLNHIRQTYTFGDDIANALESKTPADFTKLKPRM
jgi:hypothetical protein